MMWSAQMILFVALVNINLLRADDVMKNTKDKNEDMTMCSSKYDKHAPCACQKKDVNIQKDGIQLEYFDFECRKVLTGIPGVHCMQLKSEKYMYVDADGKRIHPLT